MKILMINKFFYIKGGSETYYFALRRLLEENGNQVIDFSMKDEKNFPTKYEEYFIKNIEYTDDVNIYKKINMAMNIIYSFEAKKLLAQLIVDEKPDVIHLHMFQHQISPSILGVIKKYNIPTVYTAHDLKMICLNYKMMHHGRICEQCKDQKYYYCVKNKCVKNSYAKSLINVIEGYLHKWIHSYDVIDKIIVPSEFYYQKFIEFGIKPERVVHIPNFLSTDYPKVTCRDDKETYYVYFGRLSEEKGVLTLLRAFTDIPAKLYIVGTGSVQDEATQYINNKHLNNVCLLGFMSGQALIDIVGNAKAVILPSEWYENGPYSAIEALQMARPVIGANIGGIPELIDGNGLLFESGNTEDLAEQVRKIEMMTINEYEHMKQASRSLFEKKYTAEKHYENLKNVYESCLDKKNGWCSILGG